MLLNVRLSPRPQFVRFSEETPDESQPDPGEAEAAGLTADAAAAAATTGPKRANDACREEPSAPAVQEGPEEPAPVPPPDAADAPHKLLPPPL